LFFLQGEMAWKGRVSHYLDEKNGNIYGLRILNASNKI